MNPYIYGESAEEEQRKSEFPDPAPKYLLMAASGSFYQVDMDPNNPRLLMWKGKGIMAQKAKTLAYISTLWEEIPIREIHLPLRHGQPLVFITRTRCETTTSSIIGRQILDELDKKMNPTTFII